MRIDIKDSSPNNGKTMNNEQQKAKELAELLTAFADGKQLQHSYNVDGWQDLQEISIGLIYTHWGDIRIKPETKRVALTESDLIERIKLGFEYMWIKSKNSNNKYLITAVRRNSVTCNGSIDMFYETLVGDYVWLIDNSPCYKEVEDE